MQLIRIGCNHDTGRNLEIWLYFLKKFQLGFSSKIEVLQLSSAQVGTFTARARSSRKIPAQNHLYYLAFCENRCRRSKFPSHWLSDRLSYESAIVLKLEVLDLGLLLLMCFFCVVCAFRGPSQAQSYFYIFQVLYKNSIFHFCCFGADWTGQ